MFGIDDALIAGLVSMIAGAAMQTQAVSQARGRQQHARLAAMQRQHQFQQQAEQTVRQQTQDFAHEQRAQRQQAIAQRMEQTLQPEQSPPTLPGEAPAMQGHLSQDYFNARAQAQVRVQRDAQRLAHLLGQTTAAQRLRQQEGWALGDTGLALNHIGRHAQGIQAADQVGIEQAGIPSLWQQLVGGLLQSAGSIGMMKGWGGSSVGSSNGMNLLPWNWGSRR